MRVIEFEGLGRRRTRVIAVRLTPSLNALLDIIARDLGIPKSALLREAVEEVVREVTIDGEDTYRAFRKWGVVIID